jgi:hypothetical protein
MGAYSSDSVTPLSPAEVTALVAEAFAGLARR